MGRRALVGTVATLGLVALVGLFASFFLFFSSPIPAYAQGTNSAPTFTEGATATRNVDENTAAYQNIGAPIAATDSDTDDRLTYSIKNARTSPFTIVRSTGQLQVGQPLDHETKSSYEVVIQVTDSEDADGIFENPAVIDDTITVTITVNNVEEAESVSLSWKQPQVSTPITASLTDLDGINPGQTWQWASSGSQSGAYTPLSGHGATSATYTPQSRDADKWLRATASYTDGQGASKTALAVSSRAVRTALSSNKAPAFRDVPVDSSYSCSPHEVDAVCRRIPKNTPAGEDIYYPVKATDSVGDEFHYSLSGTDHGLFRIDPVRGTLFTTKAHAFNDERNYAITITATDPSDTSDSITITLKPSGGAHNPVVIGPGRIEYPENGTWLVAAYPATTAEEELGYTHGWIVGVQPGGGDGDFFRLDDDGRLTFIQPPDFENPADEGADNTYSFSIEVYHTNTPLGKPRGHTVGINVTVTVVDVPNEALEIDGPSAVRYAEHGTEPVANYSLTVRTETVQWVLSGADGNEFKIDADGALTFNESPDYENPTDTDAKNDYLLTITAYTPTDAKTEFVRVQVTDINEPPAFDEGETATREVEPDAALNSLVGAEVTTTDPDVGDYPSYSLPDATTLPFAISEHTGQLSVDGAIEANRASYSVVVLVTDNADADDNYDATADDRITVTVNVAGGGSSNNVPEFPSTETGARSIAENTTTVENVGAPVIAEDDDTDDTLTYTLGGTDAGFFGIVDTSGQIQTKAGQTYDFETKPSYSVTVTADDSNGGTATKDVTITLTNVDEDGTVNLSTNQPTARVAITATVTDLDKGVTSVTWQWAKSSDGSDPWTNVGTDSSSYTPADDDFGSYLRATASYTDDQASGKTAQAQTTQTVQTGTNRPADFSAPSTTREVAENTAAGQPVGIVVEATDADGDTLTYSLVSGGDAGLFDIDTSTGQIKVKTETTLDYEGTRKSYIVSVEVTDSKSADGTSNPAMDDSIIVTINVTDVNEAPEFDAAAATRSIAENSAATTNVGAVITATDPDADATLTYSLSGTDASSFTIDSSGQIKVGASPTLDYESAKKSYTVNVDVHDSKDAAGNADTANDNTIDVTINVTDVNEKPAFTDGASATRSIAENSATDANIGPRVAATDTDTGDTLTYTLGGTDSASFSIVGTSGQLKTKAALNKEADDSYSVTVAVRDSKNDAGNPDTADDATITVTITVTDANEPPTITGTSNVSYAENRTDAVATYTATDPEGSINITWSKSGDDADDFSINAGVLTFVSPPNFEAAVDHNTDNVYLVTVAADDGSGNTASVDVTVTVTDVNEPPEFDDRPTTTREVPENTEAGQPIGNPIAATDPDDGDTLIYSLDSTSSQSNLI